MLKNVMDKCFEYSLFPLFILSLFSVFVAAEEQTYEENAYIDAYSLVKPWPVLDIKNTHQAYQIQQQWLTAELGDMSPLGFKRGLTTQLALDKFGLDKPVTGVLLPGTQIFAQQEAAVVINTAQFLKPMLELEIAFIIKRDISEPIESRQQLLNSLDYYCYAIEIPDLGFTAKPSGLHVIANNVAARQFMLSSYCSNKIEASEDIAVELQFESEAVYTSHSNQVLEGQLEAAQTMVNQLIAQGWKLERGQFLLTGSIGPMVPANLGHYRAVFDSQTIEIIVELGDTSQLEE